MSIWSEIKSSINSNLSKPLNELIGDSQTALINKINDIETTIVSSGGG